MSYITKTDLETSIEQALLEALDFSSDDSVITTACAQAISQLWSYLQDKYNITDELAKTTGRDDLVLMIARDLAIYHIWTYVDPASIPHARVARYTAAMDFLKAAQLGTASLNIGPATTTYSPIAGGSNDKRVSHY